MTDYKFQFFNNLYQYIYYFIQYLPIMEIMLCKGKNLYSSHHFINKNENRA